MTTLGTTAPLYELNDGSLLPAIGLGTAPLPDDDAEQLVISGLDAGYRLVDTGAIYGNERGVGAGIAASSVPREDVRVITKVRGSDQGRVEAAAAARASRERLGVEYIDLYLIHWPMPTIDRYLETWEALIRLRDEGLVRSIGVSNFLPEHLQRLVDATGVVPAVNQIELHPGFAQDDVRAANAELGIRTLGYSPLGRGSDLLADDAVVGIAEAHDVSPARVALRWQVQLGSVPLPRTANPQRQADNLAIFDLELSADEVERLSALRIGRIGWDPASRVEL